MNWAWLLKILIPLFGKVLIEYILPLVNTKVKSQLEKVLPIAEHWVASVETTGLSGSKKKIEAVKHIINDLKAGKIEDVEKGIIDTAIQMAWIKLGLNEKGEVIK